MAAFCIHGIGFCVFNNCVIFEKCYPELYKEWQISKENEKCGKPLLKP
jgi:hypothetical protein